MPLKDSLLALLVAFLWGAQVTAVKIGGAELPPILMVAMRYAIMALFLLPLLKRVKREQFASVALIATITGTLHFGLLYCGIARVDASTSAIIYQLAAPFTLVLAFALLGEVLKLRLLAGILLAFAGVLVLLATPSAGGTFIGMLLVALAALAFAAGSVLTKRLGPLDPLALSAWTAVIAAPQLLLWSFVQEGEQWARVYTASAQAWWAVLYTALSGGLLGFGLWFWLLGRNSMQQLSPYLLLVPVFAIAVSQVMLAEGFSQRLVIGAVLTLSGVALCQLRLPARFFLKTGSKGQGVADEPR
ncbi:EamA family transporter [Pseudomonas sp. NA13]|uniref:EamA family transporter n=1 Tax=Pseudomonas brassicacearum TaxID=930166 RepID=A0AAJ3FYM8_9PSED|nr:MULTISPECIES: DMT family transporter [Pseudomonas]NUT81683.1 EamA family transporter [Pseudomonas brassicacearum]QGA49647.1 EamA family transporter [Pseudomonas brassicacearum]